MLQLNDPCSELPQRVAPRHARKRIEVSLLFQESIAGALWDGLERGISSAENAKANRFVSLDDKRACVAAHWLKRGMLTSADPSIDPLSWDFEDGAHGKPLVLGRSDLHFNLSHCRGLVACALRRDGPVGIDVEFSNKPAPSAVAEHYFSPPELAWWQALPEAQKNKAFFGIWTLKEAFIKATGEGLSRQLRGFSVCVESLALLPQGEMTEQAPSWRFHQVEPDHQHVLALAWRSNGALKENVDMSVVRPDAWLRNNRK